MQSFANLKSLRACCAHVLGNFTLQILVRRAIRTPPRCAHLRAPLWSKSALSPLRGATFVHRRRARARVHDAPVHASNLQILVRRAIRTPPRTCASARACLSKTALSPLRGVTFMHRMRARILRIALSPLRGAIFMHRMRLFGIKGALSLLRGAIFSPGSFPSGPFSGK